jgi:hypothetical protein
MAKVFRVMLTENGKPLVGTGRAQLGARVPTDIRPDADGNVHPGTKGMSVFRSIDRFPPSMVPSRLQPLFPAAAGDDELTMWVHGEGPFADAAFAEGLDFRLDPNPAKSHHGCVVPDRTMPLEDYQSALAATQEAWKAVEP